MLELFRRPTESGLCGVDQSGDGGGSELPGVRPRLTGVERLPLASALRPLPTAWGSRLGAANLFQTCNALLPANPLGVRKIPSLGNVLTLLCRAREALHIYVRRNI